MIGIQHYDFTLNHIAGKNNILADCLSRNAISDEMASAVEKVTEITLCFVINSQSIDVKDIALQTKDDPELTAVILSIESTLTAINVKSAT